VPDQDGHSPTKGRRNRPSHEKATA
jgi:hypothetical protein